MMKKVTAIMAVVTMLVAGPVMNHVTAEAYTLEIEKGTTYVGGSYKKKQNNVATGEITIKSGVLPGSLHVSAHLIRKNGNADIIHCMNAITFDSNCTRTESYINGRGIRGINYYLAARVIDTSRFGSANISYDFEP